MLSYSSQSLLLKPKVSKGLLEMYDEEAEVINDISPFSAILEPKPPPLPCQSKKPHPPLKSYINECNIYSETFSVK